MDEKGKKKGLFSMIKESLKKSGGCCGGEGCCEPTKDPEKGKIANKTNEPKE